MRAFRCRRLGGQPQCPRRDGDEAEGLEGLEVDPHAAFAQRPLV
jgi:hypothetical protein